MPLLVDLLSKPEGEGSETSVDEDVTVGTLNMNGSEGTVEATNMKGQETVNDHKDKEEFVKARIVTESKMETLMEVAIGGEGEQEVKGEIEGDVEVTNTMMLSHIGAVYRHLDHQKRSIENLDVVKTKRMKELVEKLR